MTALTAFAFNSALGTFPRTLPARLSDLPTPFDFGAPNIGDGSTDASDAIQALVSGRGENAGAIFIPEGIFTISRPMLLGGGSGNASVMIYGSGNGSLIQGNFNGPLFTFGQTGFANTNAATTSGAVLHFASVPASVAVGQNVSNITNQASIQPDTVVLSKTSTTVTLGDGHGGSQNVSSTVASGDSIAFGSGGGSASSSIILGVSLWQQSSGGNSSCVNLAYSQSVNLMGNYLRGGKRCVNGYENAYGAYVVGNKIDPGVGNIGISLGNNTTAIGNDIAGNGAVGIRVGGSGSGVTIRGGRVENMTTAAIQLGVNVDGTSGGFANSECGGMSLEGNALGVYCRAASGSVIGPFNIHGEQGGAANAIGGMQFSGCSNTKVVGITTSGALTDSAKFWMDFNPFNAHDNYGMTLECSDIGGTVGTLFNIPQDCDLQITQCKNYNPPATQTYANRPGTYPGQNAPLDGCMHYFTDSNIGVGAAGPMAGGGTIKVWARYSARADAWFVASEA